MRALDEAGVSPEEQDSRLNACAEICKNTREELRAFESVDSDLVFLKRQAAEAIANGKLDHAAARLGDARDLDLKAARAAPEAAAMRHLSAAESEAQMGALKRARLAHAQATQHYRRAAEIAGRRAAGQS